MRRTFRGGGSPLLLSQFLRFGVVGGLGFVVDGAVLTLLAQVGGWGVYPARAVSFGSATLVTWALNRIITFRQPQKTRTLGRAKQYAGYFLIQTVGALINLGIFAGLIWLFPVLKQLPLLPLAAGASLALFFNFFAARRFVFRPEARV